MALWMEAKWEKSLHGKCLGDAFEGGKKREQGRLKKLAGIAFNVMPTRDKRIAFMSEEWKRT